MTAVRPELAQRLHAIRLKDQEGALLAANLRLHASEAGWPVDQIDAAIAVAAWAHSGAVRANRGPLPVTSYIEHPLRVALRLCYWGIADWRLVVAAILHDVVEDAAHLIASLRGDDAARLGESDARAVANLWIAEQFDTDIAEIVIAVSNPLHDPAPQTRQFKNVSYQVHVEFVLSSARPAAVKISDLKDNALSLHHNLSRDLHIAADPNARRVARLARKYRPVVEIALKHVASGDYAAVFSTEASATIAHQFDVGLRRLDQLITDTETLA